VTRTSSSYTASVGETSHTFTGNTPTRDFYSLTVDQTNKYYLRDYTMNWTTGALSWNTALTGGETVAYSIDWGSSDKIYPDLPRDDLTLTSFPRIGIEMLSVSTEPLGLGGTTHISDITISIIVWVPVNQDSNVASGFGGLTDLETTMENIRVAIRNNAKSFYTFKWITPLSRGPLIKGKNNKVLQMNQDFMIKFKVEN